MQQDSRRARRHRGTAAAYSRWNNGQQNQDRMFQANSMLQGREHGLSGLLVRSQIRRENRQLREHATQAMHAWTRALWGPQQVLAAQGGSAA